MSADETRIELLKCLFDHGDEDAHEIALAEIISSGPPEMPIEEYVPYLLSDLTENDANNRL